MDGSIDSILFSGSSIKSSSLSSFSPFFLSFFLAAQKIILAHLTSHFSKYIILYVGSTHREQYSLLAFPVFSIFFLLLTFRRKLVQLSAEKDPFQVEIPPCPTLLHEMLGGSKGYRKKMRITFKMGFPLSN